MGEKIYILVLALITTIGCTTAVDKAKNFNHTGLAYAELGQHQRAIEDFSQAIRLDPKNVEAYFSRGLAYYDKGQFDRAIADYNKAIEINPKYFDAYINRGLAYESLGNYNSACDDWQKACELGDCSGLSWAKENGLCH